MQVLLGDREAHEPSLRRPRAPVTDRLRVSFFSRDFFNHASAILMAGMMEAHDRARFEFVAHDFTPPCDDEYRRRLVKAFDRMIPLGERHLRRKALAKRHRVDINGAGRWPSPRCWRCGQPPSVQWPGHAAPWARRGSTTRRRPRPDPAWPRAAFFRKDHPFATATSRTTTSGGRRAAKG